MNVNLKQALTALDPKNDDHWTSDGLPLVQAVSTLVGKEVSRRQITDADPAFTRIRAGEFAPIGKPEQEESAPAPAPTPASTPETPKEDAPVEEDAPDNAQPDTQPDAPETTPDVSPEAPATPPATPDAPAEDPAVSAYVEPLDDVVAMSTDKVFADPKLIDRGIAEFGRQATILTSRREAILAKIKDIGRRSALLSAHRNRFPENKAEKSRETINRYLEAQRKAREQRAKRAQKFIEAGTTAQDVKDQLTGPSKIDAAMRQRKAGRGTIRPVYPRTIGSM